MYLHTATGGLPAGAIAGIVIGAVVFALLHLVVIVVIVYYMRSRSKNQKSTHGVRDQKSEYQQVKRSQSYARLCHRIVRDDSFQTEACIESLQQFVPLYFCC